MNDEQGGARWVERRRRFTARRARRRLFEASSLSPDALWVECWLHGRQARDPFSGRCVLCP